MSLPSVLRNFWRIARAEGPVALASVIREAACERWYEHRFGIRTSVMISPRALGFTDATSKEYVATDYRSLFFMLRRLRPTPDDVFLDYGCGLGRVVIAAATIPFSRVIGVELSPDLCAQARANIERARPRLRCPDVSIVETAADRYTLPDDVTVAYYFNAFGGSALQGMLEQLRRSHARRPRRLRLLCRLPARCEFDEILPELRGFKLEETLQWSPLIRYLTLSVQDEAGASATVQEATP